MIILQSKKPVYISSQYQLRDGFSPFSEVFTELLTRFGWSWKKILSDPPDPFSVFMLVLENDKMIDSLSVQYFGDSRLLFLPSKKVNVKLGEYVILDQISGMLCSVEKGMLDLCFEVIEDEEAG